MSGTYRVMNLPRLACADVDVDEDELSCPKCRRRKSEDWTLAGRRAKCGLTLGQTCPLPGGSADPSTFGPEVACQRTASGDIICSNNVIYSGSCPHAPQPNVSGVAENMPGTSIPKAPAPLSSSPAAAPSGGMSPLLVGAGVLAVATAVFFAVR